MATAMPIELAIDQVERVLRRNPAGLFTDIDGTISQVARVPSEAFIAESARESLRALGSTIAIVGAITGRGAADAAGMLGLDGTVVIGNHGYERSTGRRAPDPSVRAWVARERFRLHRGDQRHCRNDTAPERGRGRKQGSFRFGALSLRGGSGTHHRAAHAARSSNCRAARAQCDRGKVRNRDSPSSGREQGDRDP